MPGAIHDIAVQRILEMYPNTKTKGFYKAIRAATGEPFMSVGVTPDAFVIDPALEFAVAFEVEATHPVSADKMELYGEIFWYFDWCGWEFALMTTDKFGNKTALVNMAEYEAHRLVREARKLQ